MKIGVFGAKPKNIVFFAISSPQALDTNANRLYFP
jgi:hypothetical protein